MEASQSRFRIQIRESGPYLILGSVPLIQRYPSKSEYGEPMEWDPVGVDFGVLPFDERYELCRCGKSANMPFCDQSHTQHGFTGALTADRRPSSARWKVIQGMGMVMNDDGRLCSNAGFCGTRFAKAWEMIKGQDDPEVRLRILRMVANCPSGRLQISSESGERFEPQFLPSIAVIPDGPLWVRGGISIEAPDGFIYEVRNRVTLCRCGQSRNKPFCDGSHERLGFKASFRA